MRLLRKNGYIAMASCCAATATLGALTWSAPAQGAGDPARGATIFQACAACHSTTPGEHMTGPSLAKIWQRKAGRVDGFSRYSDPMKHADLVWTETTLDKWLSDPDQLIPGTSMTFPGLMSRCTRPRRCASANARSTCSTMRKRRPGSSAAGAR